MFTFKDNLYNALNTFKLSISVDKMKFHTSYRTFAMLAIEFLLVWVNKKNVALKIKKNVTNDLEKSIGISQKIKWIENILFIIFNYCEEDINFFLDMFASIRIHIK